MNSVTNSNARFIRLRCNHVMLSEDITVDKLISDIDAQIEILSAIANDSAILGEQLRLLNESRDTVLFLQLELERLTELIDPDEMTDHSTLIDQLKDRSVD